mgnify:CR=1 FL=1
MIYVVEEIVPVKKFYVVESDGNPDLSEGATSDEFMYLDSWDEEDWDKAKYKFRKPKKPGTAGQRLSEKEQNVYKNPDLENNAVLLKYLI